MCKNCADQFSFLTEIVSDLMERHGLEVMEAWKMPIKWWPEVKRSFETGKSAREASYFLARKYRGLEAVA